MKRIYLLILIALLCMADALAQVSVEAPKPTALVVSSRGDLTDLATGDEYSGEAPVTVRFYANASEVEGYSLTCSWEFFNADSGFSRDIVVGSVTYEYKFDFLIFLK